MSPVLESLMHFINCSDGWGALGRQRVGISISPMKNDISATWPRWLKFSGGGGTGDACSYNPVPGTLSLRLYFNSVKYVSEIRPNFQGRLRAPGQERRSSGATYVVWDTVARTVALTSDKPKFRGWVYHLQMVSTIVKLFIFSKLQFHNMLNVCNNPMWVCSED